MGRSSGETSLNLVFGTRGALEASGLWILGTASQYAVLLASWHLSPPEITRLWALCLLFCLSGWAELPCSLSPRPAKSPDPGQAPGSAQATMDERVYK